MENKVNFALVTSNSLMDRVPSWESYQSMDQLQFLDLIDYSKELIESDDDHKITFLVVAQGMDQTEEKEIALKEEAELNKKLEEQAAKKAHSLREQSKNILNSIYGR
tara:strand:+ start:106 stop:426 length:321 start_codon:yes stop_codon:yes gene_type:complete